MTHQRAFAYKEREAQVQRASKWGRATLLSVATALSFLTMTLLIVDQLYRPDTFVIDQLKIQGKFRHLDPAEIEAVVAKQPAGNFFSIGLAEIKQQIENLPWVQQAEVRREWPNTLLVKVVEHRPVMRWNKNKWVNSAGQVIDLPGDINVSDPIRLTGRDQDANLMLQQAVRWRKRLRLNGLELRGLELSGSHAWTLRLKEIESATEFDLLLGRREVEERLLRFQSLYAAQFAQPDRILKRVDARYPDGLAILSEESNHNESIALNK